MSYLLQKKNLELNQQKANRIIDMINNHFNIDCRIATRSREYLNPRHISIYLIRKNIDMSTKQIGKLFFSRFNNHLDHATIIHATNKIQDYIDVKDRIITKYIKLFEKDAKLISQYSAKELKLFKIKELILKDLIQMNEKELNDVLKYTNEKVSINI